jgi:hypothetical protein
MCFVCFGGERVPRELQVGVAGHAFDHLGGFADQAEAAAASGANIIYVSGLGALGYEGLPASDELLKQHRQVSAYLKRAKEHGIKLAIGYVCATSIVKLDSFDRNWSEELRRRFHSRPAEWRQQDRQGKPLKSWYGGNYEPACMNHPDWRAYEKYMIRQQLEAGCDGIFFDNPTVHPDGCYCGYCMERFEKFLEKEGAAGPYSARNKPPSRERTQRKTSSSPLPSPPREEREARPVAVDALRAYAVENPNLFLRFRGTIGRDFLAEMRAYARSVQRSALVTANNSLNSADVLFSQARRYGYNIFEMSKAEDLVVVEDMATQPRTMASGQMIEYGATYKQLRAISHGKPLVAVTIADGDYHTPPNLVRLAMAEAAANGAAYLSWPTWPEGERTRMIEGIKPEADFLRQNSAWLNKSEGRADVVLFLPFRKWLETDTCLASQLAASLTAANVQYEVICEDDLAERKVPAVLSRSGILLTGSMEDFTENERRLVAKFTRGGGIVITAEQDAHQEPGAIKSRRSSARAIKPDWLSSVKTAVGNPSVVVQGPATIRAMVRDQPRRTIVHVLNLNLQKLSSFTDKVTPAKNVQIGIRIPSRSVRSVRLLSADQGGSSGELKFNVHSGKAGLFVETTLPRVEIQALLIIEQR